MGKTRRCDSKCHNALKPRCECWCWGIFHGQAGKVNREEFLERMNKEVSEGKHPGEAMNEFIESVPILQRCRDIDDVQWVFSGKKEINSRE